MIFELPGLLEAVSEDAVRQAAASLQASRRAVLELVAGGTR